MKRKTAVLACSLLTFIALIIPHGSFALPIGKCQAKLIQILKDMTQRRPNLEQFALFIDAVSQVNRIPITYELSDSYATNILHSLVLLRAAQVDPPRFNEFLENNASKDEARRSVAKNLELLAHFIVLNHARLTFQQHDPEYRREYRRRLTAMVRGRAKRKVKVLTRIAISHQRFFWSNSIAEKLSHLAPKVDELVDLNSQLYRQSNETRQNTSSEQDDTPPSRRIANTAEWLLMNDLTDELLVNANSEVERSRILVARLLELQKDMATSPDPDTQQVAKVIKVLVNDLDKMLWPNPNVLGQLFEVLQIETVDSYKAYTRSN